MLEEKTKSSQKPIRVRFAPSPTGFLHVGGARTALFNYLYAKANGGKFILRVEDTDRERSSVAATKQLIAALRWMGLDWDEGPFKKSDSGPYFQSERLHIYQRYFEKLQAEGSAYLCYCSDAELKEKRELAKSVAKPFLYDGTCRNLSAAQKAKLERSGKSSTLRFLVLPQEIVFDDAVKGEMHFDTSIIGDFIIRKSDGFPSYNFAVVVDDASMEISHVLRGDDHISNTPRQILLFKALGFPLPIFAHVAMILGPRKEKLSKRDGASSVEEFQKAGYYSDAFINHLALLGWSPADGEEYLSREKLEHAMKQLKFSSAPAIFDYAKLDYFNGRYIRMLPEKQFLQDMKAFLVEHKKNTKSETSYELEHVKIDTMLLALRGYCKNLSDMPLLLENIFQEKVEIPMDLKPLLKNNSARNLFELALKIFSETSESFIQQSEFERLKSKAKAELSLYGKNFFVPLRIKITGKMQGLELPVFFSIVTRKKILKRLLSPVLP